MAEAVTTASSGKSDEFRARQYRKAAQVIRGLAFDLADGTEAELAPLRRRLGPRTFAKVEEWIRTGGITKAQTLAQDPRVRELTDLCAIWGVGSSTAHQWRNMGIRNIDDVRARAMQDPKFLSHMQAIGVKHFEDFQQKMPRAEVAEIFGRVAREARIVFDDPMLEVQCCGSYRRGRPMCGDADVLICSRFCGNENRILLNSLASRLAAEGFVTAWVSGDRFADTTDHEGSSATFLGVCRLRPDLPYRRLDIKVWPESQYAFALLHFTGSDHFNRSMRLFARRMGYTLSDHGLSECRRVKGERVWQGPTVACRTERDIFNALGLEYVPPTQREVVPRAFETPPGAVAADGPGSPPPPGKGHVEAAGGGRTLATLATAPAAPDSPATEIDEDGSNWEVVSIFSSASQDT